MLEYPSIWQYFVKNGVIICPVRTISREDSCASLRKFFGFGRSSKDEIVSVRPSPSGAFGYVESDSIPRNLSGKPEASPQTLSPELRFGFSTKRARTLRDYTPNISNMNRAEATLIGLLYTDGCLSPKGKSGWRFYFSNKSERLVALFRECMMQCFALPSSRVRLGSTNDGLYRAIVDSKAAGDLFTRRFGTFRTLRYKNGILPKARLPVQELLQHHVAEDFLRAAFSADGGVNLYAARRFGARGETRWLIRGVYIACAHPALRRDYCNLLDALGIRARNVATDGKVKIETKKDIRAFYEKVGFIEGVRITHTSKFWPEVEKQALLERLIESYQEPSAVYSLQQFDLVK